MIDPSSSFERDFMLELTVNVVTGFVSHQAIAAAEVPELIRATHAALVATTARTETPVEEELQPAVSIKSSVKPDYIVCLEDGKKLKMLKRYLRTNYNLTPEEYRAKWRLPRDYPMVAPNYAEQRRSLAKSIGLGKKAAPMPAPARAAARKSPKR